MLEAARQERFGGSTHHLYAIHLAAMEGGMAPTMKEQYGLMEVHEITYSRRERL
jgi:hypothetical protein